MPFQASCPQCQDAFTVPDLARGKQVLCDKCGHAFVAGVASQVEPAPVPVDPVIPVLSVAEASIEDAVPASSVAKPTRAPLRRRFEEDEDERDSIRRRPIRKSHAGLWVGVGIAVFVLIVVGGGFAAVILFIQARKQPVSLPTAAPTPVGPAKSETFLEPFTKRMGHNLGSHELREVHFSNKATHRAAVYCYREGIEPRVDCFDLDTGKKLSTLAITKSPRGGDRMAFSPEGTRFAFENFENEVVIFSAADGGVVARWQPYRAKEKPGVGDNPLAAILARVDFLAEDRVLTINQAGGIDLWSLPNAQPIYHRPSEVAGPFFEPTWGMALSPDRQVLALFNSTGFNLIDAAKGELLCKTGAIPKLGTIHNAWGAAFSPDSRQLAVVLTVQSDNQPRQALATWDIPTGRFGKGVLLANVPAGAIQHPIWWGTTHVTMTGVYQQIQVIELARSRSVCRLEIGRRGERGVLYDRSCDGLLWYGAGTDDAPFLTGVALPEAELRRAKDAPDNMLLLAAEGVFRLD